MKKLVIDLGHGGYDPGAVGKGGTKESDVVLKIGKYLESMLKEVYLVIVVLEVWKFGSIIVMISILMSFVVVCVMKFLVFLILEIGE